jgi:hypothetical protein
MARHCWLLAVALGGMACSQTHSTPFVGGGCSPACSGGQACVNRVCVIACAEGLSMCGGPAGDGGPACADLSSDPFNCGACAQQCDPGNLCSGGSCIAAPASCPAGWQLCTADAGPSPYCANVTDDPLNCGACGAACSEGDICRSGQCLGFCPSGFAVCQSSDAGDLCVDSRTDRDNCGVCGKVCGLSADCSDGACLCKPGFTRCGTGSVATCVDLDSDAKNCGACGQACTTCEACAEGACVADVVIAASLTLLILDGGSYYDSYSSTSDGSYDYIASVTLGDFNGDGANDIAVLVWSYVPLTGLSENALIIFYGDGGVGFPESEVAWTDTAGFYSVTPADLNGDGRTDLIISTTADICDTHPWGTFESGPVFEQVVAVAYSDVDGGFSRSAPMPVRVCDTLSYGPLVTDFNSDGRPDIVLLQVGGPTVFYGLPDGGFDQEQLLPVQDSGYLFSSFAVGDVDDDGQEDLLLASDFPDYYDGSNSPAPEPGAFVLAHAPDGGLQLAGEYFPLAPSSPLVRLSGPLILDGEIDFLSQDLQAFVLDADAGLVAQGVYPLCPPGTLSGGLLNTVDINGDGLPDLVTWCQSGVYVAMGHDGGGFGVPTLAFEGPVNGTELDGDGRLELIGIHLESDHRAPVHWIESVQVSQLTCRATGGGN